MGEEKENKRERYENINIECLLMEKKGSAFILFVSVGLFYFSFALDLHLIHFLLVFTFVGMYIGDNCMGWH